MAELLLIIPFYNESFRISKQEYIVMFEKYSEIDFLLVDDASTDNTLQMLEQFSRSFSNVFFLQNSKNSGKAESIRQGFLQFNVAQYQYIGYFDADLATPIEEMIKLFHFISKSEYFLFVMGSRIKLIGNNVQRSLVRHYFGRIFATVISQFILKTPIYDTQCGAKIIATDLAIELFKNPFKTKWLFDVELLLRFKKIDTDYYKKVAEIPLDTWIEKGNSKIRFKDMIGFPLQLLQIYFHYDKK